jgi:DNA-binding MarR family transcriptional regulator
MGEWTFITNHGLILTYLARHPQSTAREIAHTIGITEWTVHKIISELEEKGYIQRKRTGRQNVYSINPMLRLRHETVRDVMVGDLLKVLGWKRRPKPPAEGKTPDQTEQS